MHHYPKPSEGCLTYYCHPILEVRTVKLRWGGDLPQVTWAGAPGGLTHTWSPALLPGQEAGC